MTTPITSPSPDVSSGAFAGFTIITILICVFACFWLYIKFADSLDAKLADSRRSRGFLHLVFGLLLPVFLAITVDVADFSALRDETGSVQDLVFSQLSIVLCSVGLLSQMFWWRSTDKWDERLENHKEETRKANNKKADMETQRDFQIWMSEAFLRVVQNKAERATNALREQKEASLPKVLGPEAQIIKLITTTYELLARNLNAGERMRIALFEDQEGVLQPLYSWDGSKPNCLKSPLGDNRHKYNIAKSAADCAAVYAVTQKTTFAVSNTEHAAAQQGNAFHFFEGTQHSRIKSFMAIPLACDDNNEVKRVICLDSSQVDYFDGSMEEKVELVRENLERRLLFECHMQQLLDQKSSKGTSK